MKRLIVLLFSIFIFSLGTTNVSAEMVLPFSVEPIMPDKQEMNVTNYISIKADGNYKEDTYSFKLKNNSSEETKIKIDVVDAYTSPGGVVQYTKNETENSKITNKDYKLSEYLSLDKNEITLKGNEEITIHANMNYKEVEGILLGGITFQTIEQNEDSIDDSTSIKINNKINVVFGVKIESDYNGKVELEVSKPHVDPMPSYYSVRLPIEMKSPSFKNVEVNYEILQDGKSLFSGTSNYEFAPKTKVNIDIPWEHDVIKKNNDYQIKGELTYNEDNTKTTNDFDFHFKYAGESTIEKISKVLKAPQEEGSNYILYMIPTILFVAILIIIIIKRKKKIK